MIKVIERLLGALAAIVTIALPFTPLCSSPQVKPFKEFVNANKILKELHQTRCNYCENLLKINTHPTSSFECGDDNECKGSFRDIANCQADISEFDEKYKKIKSKIELYKANQNFSSALDVVQQFDELKKMNECFTANIDSGIFTLETSLSHAILAYKRWKDRMEIAVSNKDHAEVKQLLLSVDSIPLFPKKEDANNYPAGLIENANRVIDGMSNTVKLQAAPINKVFINFPDRTDQMMRYLSDNLIQTINKSNLVETQEKNSAILEITITNPRIQDAGVEQMKGLRCFLTSITLSINCTHSTELKKINTITKQGTGRDPAGALNDSAANLAVEIIQSARDMILTSCGNN
jgi:hypothetical protein